MSDYLTPDEDSDDIPRAIRLNMELCVSRFNFHRVQEVMRFLKWHWGGNTRPPNEEEMKSTSYELMENAYRSDSGYCSTGGFTAEYEDGNFFLSFNVSESDTLFD